MGGNAQIAYDWMIDRGYSPNITAAFVGNMMQESYDDIDPTASDGSAFGICQWDDRKDALIQYANDNGFDVNDIYTQLNFMDYELHTSEKQAAADIEAAGDSPEDAAYVIANEYERCQVPNDSRRLQNSRDVYDTFYDGSDYQGSGIGNGNTSSGGSGTDNQIYYDISDVDGVDSDDETDLTKQKMNLLARDYYNQYGRRLWITSMARSGDPDESWHNTGQAFDTASDTLEQSAEERQWLIQKGSEYGLTALDEYEHPSANATGGHVHFSDHGDALDPAVVKSLVGNAGNPVEFGGGFLDTDISRHLTPEEYQATIDNYHAWDTPTKAADNPPSLFESIWHGFKESGNFAYEAANALYNDLFYSDFDAFGKSKITDDDRQYVKDAMGAGNESTAQWIIDNSRDKTQMMRLLQQKMDDAQEDQRFAAYTSKTIGGQIGGLILGAALDPLNLAPMLKPLTVAKMITRLGSAVEDVGKIDQIANSVALADKASLKIPLAMGNIAAASTAQEYIRGKTTGEDTNLAGAALMGGIAGGVLKTLGMAGSRLLRNRELSNIATKADNVQYGSLNEAARNESAYTAKLDTKKIADSMNDNAFFSGSTNKTAQSMADRDDVLALSLSDAKKLGNRLSINVPDNTKGFYVPNEGYSVIVKDNIKDVKQLSGVLMHEIGVHQNLQTTIGADKYGKLMSQIDTGIKNNDVMWATAARMANSNDPEEVLGYAAENGLLGKKTTSKVSAFKDSNNEPIKFYHGTNAEFTKFDANKSGGLIHFTPDKNAAKGYASGEGGGRAHITDEDSFIEDENGNAYTKNKKGDWVAVGYLPDEGDFSTLQKGKTKFIKIGDKIPKEELNNMSSGISEYVAKPKRFYVKEAYLDLKKPLDLINNQAESLKVLQGIQKGLFAQKRGNRTLQDIIDDLKENKGTGVWHTTKYAFMNNSYKDIIIPALKKRGYDGIIFKDDLHPTYAVFDNAQVLDKAESTVNKESNLSNSIIDSFKNGLDSLGLGKQKFNNAQIMDMISESIKNSKLAQYGASVNSDGSVNMNGVHFSTDNLYSPSALEDYKAMAADRAEAVDNIGTANMTHRKFQRAINGVGNKLEDTKLTRTPFGFFLHSVSPTLSRMSTSIFEDPQMRGVPKITNMPSAERMTDYFRGQLQPYVQNILQARQDWVKQNYGAIGAYNPFRADNRRLPFDKMVIDNFNHEYRGTTISKAVSDQIDDNVRKATAELKKFWDARIDLGKSSGTLFSGKEENNLIENIWYPVNNEFHRLIDRDCYRDMVSHFHAPYKEKTGDEAAHKFLEDYCYEASGDPKSKQIIKDFIDRERTLEYQRKIKGMTPEEVKQYGKPVPASDKDVEDFRDIKAKEWAVKALNPVENTLDGKEVVDGKVIDSSLGDLNFFRGKLPMDTGHIKMLPDGTPFTFDDNMRYYDLEHMLNRTMNRFAGEAALKTVFGDSTNYHNFLEKVHREFNLAQLSGTISQSEVERMTKDFDDTMHDMRGMRPARDIYSDTDVIGKVFNNMAYATRGGNMGYNQLGDLGGSIAYNGLHTLFGVFNPLRKAVQDMRLGKAPSEMLDDLNFQMFGDPIERHIWQGSWGDRMTRAAMTKEFHGMSGVWHKALIGAANVTHNFGKFTSQINMLGHMTDTMIHEARSSALCDAIRFAHGKQFSGVRNPFSAQKIKALGRHVDVEALKADIRKYIPWDGQKGTVPQEANVDAWRAESPKTFFELYDLVQNQTARSVLLSTQKGNRSMYKDQNWATRLLFMFKDFPYRSNNAQTMRALQNRERDDAVALALSMITNTAAFAARNSLKVGALYAMGNSDAAQKVKDNYLNDGALARAALFRTGFLSPLSNVNDVVEAATGAPTIRTTVTNSGRGEPINDMGDVAGNVVKQIPAVDTISDYTIKPINAAIALSDGRGSQRDLRQMLKLIPVPDFIPYTQAIDTWSQMQGLPDKRPKKK